MHAKIWTSVTCLSSIAIVGSACGETATVGQAGAALVGDAGVDGQALGLGGASSGGAAAVGPGGAPGIACDGGVGLGGACGPLPGGGGVGSLPAEATGCAFDTHTIFPFQGRVIESITARGKLFNFESDGSPWPTNGMDLTQVSYFAAGPCGGQAPGSCALDTRAFVLFPGNHLIEFVTARGRTFAWENGTPTDPGSDLATSPRYREVCALGGQATCAFDTRTFLSVGGQITESITAFGRYFAFDQQGNRSKDSGTDLTVIPRYASGPCQGRAAGQCRFDTQTYGVSGDKTVEVVTAAGRVWRWVVGDPSFPEVQPSGVPTSNVAAWAAACR